MAKAGETGGVSSLWASAGAASESRQAPVASAAAAVDGVAAKSLVALASAIDDMAGTVLSGAISDEELVGSVGVLRRLEAVMAAERYRRVAEVDARCAYRVAGAGSTETWLSEAQQVARSDAAVEVTVARALLELPATAGMLARGEIDEAALASWGRLGVKWPARPPPTPRMARWALPAMTDSLTGERHQGTGRPEAPAAATTRRARAHGRVALALLVAVLTMAVALPLARPAVLVDLASTVTGAASGLGQTRTPGWPRRRRRETAIARHSTRWWRVKPVTRTAMASHAG